MNQKSCPYYSRIVRGERREKVVDRTESPWVVQCSTGLPWPITLPTAPAGGEAACNGSGEIVQGGSQPLQARLQGLARATEIEADKSRTAELFSE